MGSPKSVGDLEDTRKHPLTAGMKVWVFFAGVLGVVFVLGAVFHVWLYVQQAQNGYRLAQLQEENEELISVHRKLRLEWSRFQDPHHLEGLGREKFGLNPPRSEQKVPMR